MKYIINFIIVFDLDNRRLSLYNDDRIFIELTKPATRLLLELIKNNKINTSREDLLNNVWINYGFSASNAGLNNYISELRKSFITLEMNREVIITIPKFGFRMDADIQSIMAAQSGEIPAGQPPQKDPENKPDRPDAKQEEGVLETPEKQACQPEPKNLSLPIAKSKMAKMSLKFTVLLILIALLLIIALVIVKNTETKTRQVHLYRDGECNVSTLGSDKGKGDMVNRARNYITRLNLDCHNTKYDILYIEQRPGVSIRNRVFIAACVKANDNEYSSCSNYKYNQVTIK